MSHTCNVMFSKSNSRWIAVNRRKATIVKGVPFDKAERLQMSARKKPSRQVVAVGEDLREA